MALKVKKLSEEIIKSDVSVNRWIKELVTIWSSKCPFYHYIMENYNHGYGEMWAIVASPNSPSKTAPPHTRGIGKSVLAIKLLLTVYRDWDHAKKYLFYTPMEFVNLVKELLDRGERIPLAVWDDAGEWLFRANFRNKFVVRVAESLEVLRTVMANLMFTATSISKLVKAVRESTRYIITISTVASSKTFPKYKKSLARLYFNTDASEFLLRKTYPQPVAEWRFLVYLHHVIYQDYLNYRQQYVQIAIDRVKQELDKLASQTPKELKAQVEEAEEEFEELLKVMSP